MRIFLSVTLCLLLNHMALAGPFKSPEAIQSAKGFRKAVIAEDLNHPWAMAWLPDGSMLVTERSGSVRHLNADGSTRTKSVPGVPSVFAKGQGGLLDIALHPNFSDNDLVYFTFSSGSSMANRTTLASAIFDGKRFSNLTELFRVSQSKTGSQHFGSRLLWLPDNTMLMTIGDGGNPPISMAGVLIRTLAQDGKKHFGKVLRLNGKGEPADRPGFASDIALPEIHSMGHRNIQGIAYDPIRKKVWASEHGALGGDELNLIVPGANYGWPKATFSKEYLGARTISEYTALPGMVSPALLWEKAIAPSGLAVYTGDRFPDWRGDLFAGGLRDQSVRRVILDDGGTITGEEIIRIGQRVRDVRQGPDGYLYVLTDESDGKVIRLEPSKETDPNP